MVRRLLLSVWVLVSYGQTTVAPPPEKGTYTCIQLGLTAALPLPGLAPGTTVTSAPGPLGNLILDGAGKYQFTLGRGNSGSYRYDAASGRVNFSGLPEGVSTGYATRGNLMSFEFRGKGVSFTCSAKGSRDYGTAGNRATETRSEQVGNGGFAGRLYFATQSGGFRINLATGKVTALGLSTNFDVRPTGEVVYVNSRGEMILTNEEGSDARQVEIYGGKNYSPRFSPDGSKIAYYGAQKPKGLEAAMMGAYSNANLEPLIIGRDGRLLAALGTAYAQPTWTPDGRVVVAGSKASGSVSPQATTGIFISDPSLRSLRRLPLNYDAPHSPAVSPDGTKLAFANGPLIWVANLDGSNPRKVYEGNTKYVFYPTWSPDGRALSFIDNQVVGIVSLDGKELAVKGGDGTVMRSASELVWLK